MSLETIVDDLVAATEALHTAVTDKRTVLDNAAQQAAASLTTTQGLQAQAATSAATAAAKATEATNNATQIAAYKTAAAALDTTTTATAAVTNLLPDMLAKKDPARHPFRKKMPTLVLDFERQKCHRYSPSTGFGETPLNTFMTFARNSTATYTGPDGLIKTAAANEARYDYDPLTGECKGLLVEEQRTNLLTYSSNLEKKPLTWCRALPFATKSPDGYLLGAKLIADTTNAQHRVEQSSTVVIGTQYTASVFAKAGELSQIQLRTANDLVSFVFDLSSGTATNQGSVGTGGITSVGNGWYLCWCCYAPTLTTAYTRVNLLQGGSNIFTGDNMSGVYLFGLQLEAGAFPTSYIPTPAVFSARASTATYLDANGVVQTAASGVARSNAYDYDSDGVLRPIGLLLEASATNQLLYSEQFDNAGWGKTGYGVASAPVVTANYGIAPDGQTTADRVVFALNGGTTIDDLSMLNQQQTTIAGNTYTQSIWLKTVDGSTKQLQLSLDNTAPKVITVTGTWQRFSNTGVAPDTIRGFRLCLRGTIGTSDSAGLLVWGAQQGVGSYPTSYIPTTSAQVTRAADTSTSAQATRAKDAAKVDGVNFNDWHNIDGFTAFATYEWGVDVNQQAFGRGVFGFSDTNNSNSWCYVYNGSAYSALVANTNSGQQFYKTSGSPNEPANVMRSIAFRYKKNNAAVSFNGGSVASDTNCELPVFNSLNIGSTSLTNIYRLGGHVKRIVVYPTAFTDEELQALTSA